MNPYSPGDTAIVGHTDYPKCVPVGTEVEVFDVVADHTVYVTAPGDLAGKVHWVFDVRELRKPEVA